jgi:hypothetical protein
MAAVNFCSGVLQEAGGDAGRRQAESRPDSRILLRLGSVVLNAQKTTETEQEKLSPLPR